MRSLAIPCVVMFAAAAATPALAAPDSDIGAPPVMIAPHAMPPMAQMPAMPRMPHMPPQAHGAMAAVAAPYRRPFYGYQLPREWISETHYIGDFDGYGLARPAGGFGWSRYYDAAVLTDQWGRVYDWREDMDWDRGPDRRQGGGVGIGGAVAGAVVGGIAGNVIAGDGNRTAGTLIGAGAGALAGLAIDGSRHSGGGLFGRHHRDDRRDDDRNGDRDWGRDHGRVQGGHYDYRGRWTGSWDGGPVRSYEGEWHGSVHPHWGGGSDYGYRGGSWGTWGYDGGGTTVTTVVVQAAAPVMTTRTISYDVVSYAPVRRRVVHHYRPKPQCACGS